MTYHYCYICNRPMTATVYVCDEHKTTAAEAFSHVLRSIHIWRPRLTPQAPRMDLTQYGICTDEDLEVDKGL